MFGLDVLRNVVKGFFRSEAKAAAIEGTLEGIADALEHITGERPELPCDVIGVGRLENTGSNGKGTAKPRCRKTKAAAA